MKIKLLILLLALGFGASAQTYTNVGANGLQRKVNGSDTTFRHNLGSAGFLYTKSLASYKALFSPVLTAGYGLARTANELRVDSVLIGTKSWINGRLLSYYPLTGNPSGFLTSIPNLQAVTTSGNTTTLGANFGGQVSVQDEGQVYNTARTSFLYINGGGIDEVGKIGVFKPGVGLMDLALVPDGGNVAVGKITTGAKLDVNGAARISTNDGSAKSALRNEDKAVANGVASLDGSGRVPLSQLPTGTQTYVGTWNASTNTPTLIDGTGTNGQYYIVNVAGTQNLGSGSITYALGDNVIYNGTIWQKVANSGGVTSVNGQTAAVVLTTTDISEGSNLYYTEARVNANTNVAANTSARHNAVTIGTSNGLSLSTQQLSLALASTSTTGALSDTDWDTFNNKENSFSKNTAFNKNFGTSTNTVAEGNDSRINNGQTAFGWGNHASAGYLTPTSTNTLTNKSGNISQWTNNVGYLTSAPNLQAVLTAGNTATAVPYLDGGQMFVRFSPLDIKLELGANAITTTKISDNSASPLTVNASRMDVAGSIRATSDAGTSNAVTVNSQLTGLATTSYADAKVADNLTASTTVAPSKTAVNTALALKADATALSAKASLTGGNTFEGSQFFSETLGITTVNESKVEVGSFSGGSAGFNSSQFYFNNGGRRLTLTVPNLVGADKTITIPDESGTLSTATTKKLTSSGTGAATTISIAHGLTGITSANAVVASANTAAAGGYSYVDIDVTNVNFYYTVAPASGTNNLIYSVTIK